jgi:transposase
MKQSKEGKLTDQMDGFEFKKINYADYEISFRRWLVSQIDSQTMSMEEARDRFHLSGPEYRRIIRKWQENYSEDFHLSLSFMSSKERSDNKELEKRIKELEKQLEKAQMKNVALNTLIDVAENQFKIPIRKKPGAKQ